MIIFSPAGGPAPYHAGAVHFDGSTFFDVAAMSVADSGKLTVAGWVLLTLPMTNGLIYPLADFDPANREYGLVVQDDGTIKFTFKNPDHSKTLTANAPSGTFVFDDAWHLIIMSMDADQASGSKLAAIYIDRTPTPLTLGDPDDAFVVGFSGMEVGVPDTFGDYNPLASQDAANIIVWSGVCIAQSDNSILSADLDNFIDMALKPVDPATAIAAYGTPAIACIGNASAFGQPNLGNAGTLIKTGTLTNASTSPSD